MRPICSEFESILLEFFFLFTLYLITCINMRSPQAASSYITVKQSKLLSLWWAIVIMLYLCIWVVTGLLHLLVFRRTNVTNCASVDYSRLRSFILVHSQFLKKMSYTHRTDVRPLSLFHDFDLPKRTNIKISLIISSSLTLVGHLHHWKLR